MTKNEDEEDEVQKLFEEHVPKGLSKAWRSWLTVPAGRIREYFGEKIAMYFAFLSFYTIMLIIPSIIGIPIFIVQFFGFIPRTVEIWCSVAFGFVMIIWTTLLAELWGRRETWFAVVWGQTDFEEDETVRPAFHGSSRRSPIDDEKELYFSVKMRFFRTLMGLAISILIICTVLGIIYGLLRLRRFLYEEWKGTSYVFLATTIPSIINAVQIIVFNMIYSTLAYKMTNFENHRTQTSYENSLILKTFCFQFINSFNAILYIAFLKRSNEGCIATVDGEQVLSDDNRCTNEVSVQVRTIMIVAIIKNLVEIGTPFVKSLLKKVKERKIKKLEGSMDLKDHQRLLVRIERDMAKEPYAHKEIDGTYDDYLEIMI
jgi:hypothetical protein